MELVIRTGRGDSRWFAVGAVLASAAMIAACGPEPRPISVEVEWPDGEPEWMDDARVRAVWTSHVYWTAAWNSGNFSDERVTAVVDNSQLRRSARACAADVAVGEPSIVSGLPVFDLLSVSESDVGWVVRYCNQWAPTWKMSAGEIEVIDTQPQIIETTVRESDDGFIAGRWNRILEGDCSLEGVSVAEFVDAPRKEGLGDLEYDEIVGPDGKNIEPEDSWSW